MELSLHDLGYLYVGGSSLYSLTFIEILRILDASQERQDDVQGVRKSDLDRFEKFEREVRQGKHKPRVNR